jgi:hypothetical protein
VGLGERTLLKDVLMVGGLGRGDDDGEEEVDTFLKAGTGQTK